MNGVIIVCLTFKDRVKVKSFDDDCLRGFFFCCCHCDDEFRASMGGSTGATGGQMRTAEPVEVAVEVAAIDQRYDTAFIREEA